MSLDLKTIQALILDMNGVIIDDEPLHENAFHESLSREGFVLDPDTYKKHFAGRTDREGLVSFLPELPREKQDSLLQEKSNLYQQALKNSLASFPGIPELIIGAATSGLPLAVVTSAKRQEALLVLQSLGLGSYFQALVAAEDVSCGKPDPGGYLLSAQLLGKSPEECLVVEDSPAGVEAALAAGMQVVACLNTHEREDLTAAHFLITQASDLANLLGLKRE